MAEVGGGQDRKPATAARIYDYLLGGTNNFPADRQAAATLLAQVPDIPVFARSNRAFVHRAARFLVEHGIRQFLDIGSGIPTQGNVHDVVQRVAPQSRVVYVDIDTVAVAESLEILEGNPHATAVRADLRDPRGILEHPATRQLLDFDQPVAVLLAAVLHFVADDDMAHQVVKELVSTVVPGSYLLVSHGTADGIPVQEVKTGEVAEVYRRQTATPSTQRTRAQVQRFFAGLDLVDPGLVWTADWRPDPTQTDPTDGNPRRSMAWAGLGRKN